jgi:hypothetical protein
MRALLLAVAGTLMIGAPALAQPVAQPISPIGDISGFSGDPNALPRVIQRVATASGGDVIEARFAQRNGKPGFDVLVSKGGMLDFLRLEREGGQVQEIDSASRPTWMLQSAQRRDVSIARKAKVPLETAVRTAEQSGGGAAVAAGLARGAASADTDVHAYNVLIVKNGRTQRVAIDSSTGEYIQDPQSLPIWP